MESHLSLVISIIAALVLSAFFSGMEIAFVSSNKMLVEMDKDSNTITNRIIRFFYRRPDNFVSTMLVGNNITLVIYGILFALLFDNTLFVSIPSEERVILDTIVSTLIVLFTSEFLPKTLFKNAPNWWLSFLAVPAFLIYIVLWPISKFSTMLSKFIMRMAGVKMLDSQKEEEFSKVDLDYLVQSSIDNSNDEDIQTEVRIFHNALDFSDTKVRDCMVPRTEVNAVDINDCTLEELKQVFIESGHSKILVYEDDIDHIIGYIHSSEMFLSDRDWKENVVKVPYVPETMAAQKLMKMFLEQKKSLAVVVDEFGGTGGIVCLEDIVEEIFGEIEDEHDNSNITLQKLSDNEYLISARAEIDRINETFDLELPENDEYMTVGGLILHYYQSFPKLNEVVSIPPFEFKILRKTNTKIELVRLKVND